MTASTDRWTTLATNLITKFGRAENITFTRVQNLEYSPMTLTAVETTPITYTVKAAPVDFSLKEIDNINIVSGQKKLYIPGKDIAGAAVLPLVGDTVVLGSDTLRVLEVLSYETESVNCGFLLKVGK